MNERKINDNDFEDSSNNPREGIVISSYCRSIRIFKLLLPATKPLQSTEATTPHKASRFAARVEKLRKKDLEEKVKIPCSEDSSMWSGDEHTGTRLAKAAYQGNA